MIQYSDAKTLIIIYIIFAHRVTVAAKDEHSGISKVSFKFVVNSTGEAKNQKDFMINSQVIKT